MKKAFLILGTVVLAFTALVGIAFGANQALEKTTTTTHAVSQPVRAIEVDIDVGDVELVRGDATVEVRESLEYALNKPTVDQTIEDGVLTLKSDCSGSWFFNCNTDLRIEVPAGVDVQVHSDVGTVKAIALDSGDVRVKNNVGDIRLDLTGDVTHVEAQSDLGDIEIGVPNAAYAIDTTTEVGDDDVQDVVQNDDASRTIVAGTDVGDVNVHGR
jgi:Putative adhesin